ncbi:HNH endonuclease family protein [Streptomyces sp. NPDC093085]|uniref:HNH endonuclease family protein n=1 Tax=Streptomyces sp. NPDC093085 TaxID=3155068 RepID=UPI00343F2576
MSGVYARRMRRLAVLASSAAIALATTLLGAPTAQAAMPTPIAASTARTYLASLTVQAEGSSSGYSRDLFPHWITQSGTCNTREVVLKRDGTNVVQDSACAAVSGSWYSVYDGTTFTASSSLDIDHMVPLSEAWKSGASSWTTAQRQAFANDLTRPQLVAVSASSNRSKGDKDPANWLPPLASYKCTYVRAWVQVKYYYKLSVDSAEKTALTNALSGC